MRELTAEEIKKAETMPLDELRALALKEAEEKTEPPPKKEAKAQIIDTGKDELDNSADAEEEETEEETTTVYRKEIDLGDGSGIQVFEGDSLEELVDKLADAQRNATKKIRELNQKVRVEDTRTAKQKEDDEYVISQRIQKEPTKAIKEIVAEIIAERERETRQSLDAQSRFVQTHPDFIPNDHNGREMQLEAQRLGYTEFNSESLEKAYQNLKARGILHLKAEGSEEATEAETKETARIEQPKVEATQPRSPKRGSNVIARPKVAPVTDAQPSEDEAYTMPLDKLRELANKQLAAGQS